MREQFVLYFERSGGVTGISNVLKIDSKTLSFLEKEELMNLIQHSGFWSFSQSEKSKPGLPDRFEYYLTIEGVGVKKSIVFKESEIPGEFMPLFTHLKKKMRKLKSI